MWRPVVTTGEKAFENEETFTKRKSITSGHCSDSRQDCVQLCLLGHYLVEYSWDNNSWPSTWCSGNIGCRFWSTLSTLHPGAPTPPSSSTQPFSLNIFPALPDPITYRWFLTYHCLTCDFFFNFMMLYKHKHIHKKQRALNFALFPGWELEAWCSLLILGRETK